MKKKCIKILLALIFCTTGRAQQPELLVTNLAAKSPIEKVYLHFDRDNYIAGETAWFKGYLYSNFLPDTISTTLYVELCKVTSVIIDRKIIPVILGITNGQLELPDSLETGNYFIRAYTPAMFLKQPEFINHQSIFVFGKKYNSNAITTQQEKKIRFEFFPEGGNFIAGLINTVAFKANNENGLPVKVNGAIKNEKGEIITTINTCHDGMGMFDMNPSLNENYYAMLNEDAAGIKYFLPKPAEKGIVFKVISAESKKFFEILQQPGNPAFTAAYMIGQMQHHIVFRQDFQQGRENITGTIDVSHLNSGILQVTVFNKDNIPLSERLTFVDNGEYIQPADLVADTIRFSERGKSTFHISLKDTVIGFFSVSVTDPAFNLTARRQQNIVSTFLLTDDLKGYIHNPAYYFSGRNDSITNALDLLMMINGWRRFKWSSLLQNAFPVDDIKYAGYINVDGNLNLKGTKKPFMNKPFVLFIYSQDSSRIIKMSSTDKNGYFKIDSLLFFGRARLLFKDIRGKKSELLQVKLSNDSLAKRYQVPWQGKQHLPEEIFLDEKKVLKLEKDYKSISNGEGKLLEEATIKVKKKNALQELEEKYASGLFSGFSERTIDLVNTNEIITQENIFEYLSYRVPGLDVIRDGIDYNIYYRQGAGTASSLGLIPMTLYLDEIETDASFISSLPANQVAMIKVYNTFVGAVGNGAGGVLAIYTKKGTDLDNSVSITDMVRYQGYSIIKEFYTPDYSITTTAAKKQDHRNTLLWTPQIITNSINGKIPFTFYNIDRAKEFKVVVEGMSVNGKLLMIEKTFSRKGF